LIIDNVFTRDYFERRFRKRYHYIPYGCEVNEFEEDPEIMRRLGLAPRDYLLFIGRFIPDKGIQYLIPAFELTKTDKKLVLVGGAPNRSSFEKKLFATKDSRVLFPGYIYGTQMLTLMKNAYLYIQPSDIEGLSPVILTAMNLGTPILCSDIEENHFVVLNTALSFKKSDISDLQRRIDFALNNESLLRDLSRRAYNRAKTEFSWTRVVDLYESIIKKY